jgi:NADH-quinone oxidoreductase subunit G
VLRFEGQRGDPENIEMTDDKQITIEVDGRQLQASPGAMLIDVTDAAGIAIPRFCYHKKLSVAANCRMCLVDVENVNKPLPACATPVADGMKVHTRSPKALAAQQGTMEFLLINHPLDCPICDQGGECELQDVAMGYGQDISRYVEAKRIIKDENLGPLVATDMTRCIHCTRCVRFGAEIAGVREMGATGRGEHLRIGTYVAKTVDHELSGNIIDLCPVGALTSKPYRYQARAWELTQSSGIASHDSVGSNLYLHVKNNRVMRVHPDENEAVNETWISDRDRFSYEGLYSADRLTSPRVKKNGAWVDVEWDEALELVAGSLKSIANKDASQLAALVSPRKTLEEMYLAQRLLRGLGSGNIDSRLRQGDFRADRTGPLRPWLGLPIADLEQADAVLVIGASLRKQQPLLAHRLRKAALSGAKIIFIAPAEALLTHPALQIVQPPGQMISLLGAINKALGADLPALSELPVLENCAESASKVAELLVHAQRPLVLIGYDIVAHPEYARIQGLAQSLAVAAKATIGFVPEAANSVGAAFAGALPHVAAGGEPALQPGLNAGALLADSPRRAYLLLGVEPAADTWNPAVACQTLDKADFVVALTAWRSSCLDQVADVLLPIADFGETAGTFVNAEHRWQTFKGAVTPAGDARPAWKVLRVLGNLLDLDDFSYSDIQEVQAQLRQICDGKKPDNTPQSAGDLAALDTSDGGMYRVGDVPLYACDALVRRAPSLQKTADAVGLRIAINAREAQRLGLAEGDAVSIKQGDGTASGSLSIIQSVADGCVLIPSAVPGSETLGPSYGPVTLEKG